MSVWFTECHERSLGTNTRFRGTADSCRVPQCGPKLPAKAARAALTFSAWHSLSRSSRHVPTTTVGQTHRKLKPCEHIRDIESVESLCENPGNGSVPSDYGRRNHRSIHPYGSNSVRKGSTVPKLFRLQPTACDSVHLVLGRATNSIKAQVGLVQQGMGKPLFPKMPPLARLLEPKGSKTGNGLNVRRP